MALNGSKIIFISFNADESTNCLPIIEKTDTITFENRQIYFRKRRKSVRNNFYEKVNFVYDFSETDAIDFKKDI